MLNLRNRKTVQSLLVGEIIRAKNSNLPLLVFKNVNLLYLKVLSFLKNEGFIQSFTKKENIVILHLKETYWKSSTKGKMSMQDCGGAYNKAKKQTIKKKDLKKMERGAQASLTLLNTDKGFLTQKKALQKKLGGVPILKVI
jgi:ribosomal protein S8